MRIKARWNEKKAIPNYLVHCICTSIFMALICLKGLGTSPWMDEAMLFSNYPLNHLFESLSPLSRYDQAATPLYSTLYGWTAPYRTEIIKAVHFISIFCLSIILLGWRERSNKAILVAAITLPTLPEALRYMQEMKHYGLEAVGSLGLLSWFLNKSNDSRFTIRDAGFLLLMMLLGFPTLPIAGITLISYAALRINKRSRFSPGELLWVFATSASMVVYYILIKRLTVFQFSNYPSPYLYTGFADSAKAFINASMSLMPSGRIGTAVAGVAFITLIIDSRRNRRSLRLCLIISVILIAFTVLAGVNLYPAKYDRHVFWASSLAWIVLYEACMRQLRPRQTDGHAEINLSLVNKIVAIAMTAVMGFFAISSAMNIRKFATAEPFNDTFKAITYVREKPNLVVGLYGGAQSVTDFYSKQYQDLSSRRYFGRMRSESTQALPKNPLSLDSLKVDVSRPGAYARFWQRNAYRNGALEEILNMAPKDEKFLLLSYYAGAFERDNLSVVAKANCEIEDQKDFGTAHVYTMTCKNNSGQ